MNNKLQKTVAIDSIFVLAISADSLTLLQTANQILHLEFQTLPYSQPPISFRMLDYWVRLKRLYWDAEIV